MRQTGSGLETRLERAASSERHALPGACSAVGVTDSDRRQAGAETIFVTRACVALRTSFSWDAACPM